MCSVSKGVFIASAWMSMTSMRWRYDVGMTCGLGGKKRAATRVPQLTAESNWDRRTRELRRNNGDLDEGVIVAEAGSWGMFVCCFGVLVV